MIKENVHSIAMLFVIAEQNFKLDFSRCMIGLRFIVPLVHTRNFTTLSIEKPDREIRCRILRLLPFVHEAFVSNVSSVFETVFRSQKSTESTESLGKPLIESNKISRKDWRTVLLQFFLPQHSL